LAEARKRRRETLIIAAVLLVLLFMLACALSRPGSPASVLTVLIGR
jgi:hypothetical protein